MAYCHINIAHVYISTCGFHRPVDHSPLDFRFGWSPEILLPIKIAAVGILVMGRVLEIWALAVNRFHFLPTHTWKKTSAHDQHETVRIGPYRYIRLYSASECSGDIVGQPLLSINHRFAMDVHTYVHHHHNPVNLNDGLGGPESPGRPPRLPGICQPGPVSPGAGSLVGF